MEEGSEPGKIHEDIPTAQSVDGQQPQEGFNPLDAAVGVIVRPAPTMRRIAAARPWVTALLLAMGIALLQSLVALTTPLDALSGGGDAANEAIQGYMYAFRSPLAIGVQVLIVTPILLFLGSAMLYGVGRLLGGRGSFLALLSALAYAEVPSVISAPITAWLNLAGGLLAPMGSLITLAFGIWILVLAVIGIRESLSLSTGRAVATALVPLAIGFLLAFLVVVLVIVVAIGALSSAA